MSETVFDAKDRRDLITLGRVALFSTLVGGILVIGIPMMPNRHVADPAMTPRVIEDVRACVAAKPEIEAAARGQRLAVDWTNVLEKRLEAVNAHDPSQCGAMLSEIRENRKRLENIAMMAAATS